MGDHSITRGRSRRVSMPPGDGSDNLSESVTRVRRDRGCETTVPRHRAQQAQLGVRARKSELRYLGLLHEQLDTYLRQTIPHGRMRMIV